ncbi:hypothetical protein SPRG_15579 [Saprolegnia parasitica CBS 223.65]|uniref:Dipeptidase n=1 Tax=Saprolegnia parasitica (strain CBS 223.65) TaxID=695850 RepID=A0A067BQP7_SAPPC|nr:hypothetical protein SPRG_15579 [Saprolegnia parasitica CBS 223.65]KDO19100.1 hypothetical protein SPRG_15579 [Saprolegnia parasitica CBS 223.65]|eukprot:XP_012210203.1 hypothetical protein SPRG_15579 [Saprolegnia parasitica CBS 223.65]
MRDVVLVKQSYPRYVGDGLGPMYTRLDDDDVYNWTATPVIGQIPQVPKTYAYLDGVYGVMNEHQVALGESTCGARLWAKPLSQGGNALFDIVELSRVAMERARTAREAITSGETLTVTDTTEAWIFHILPDDTGASAVWAAQRVPATEMAVVANQFVIRSIDVRDSANYLASTNLFDVAKRNGFWDGDDVEDFDFTASYAMVREHPNQYYSTRRVWRVFTLANPSLALSPTTDVFASDYPFSTRPAALLGPADLMRFQRDHYEGTAFDLTTDKASGPYGNPDRYSTGSAGADGQFERAISLFRTAYSYVTQASVLDPRLGVVWFGHYAPHATTYVPIYARVEATPNATARGSLRRFDNRTLFWANALLGNYGGLFYKLTSPVIRAASGAYEAAALAAHAAVAAHVATLSDADAVTYLTQTSADAAARALASATALFATLVTRFHDGYVVSNTTADEMGIAPMGYPQWWLRSAGYDYNDGNEIQVVAGALMGAALMIVVLGVAAGFAVGRYIALKQPSIQRVKA